MVAPRITRKKRPAKPVQMFVPPPQTVAPVQPSAPSAMFSGPLQAAGQKQPFDWASLAQGLGVGLLTGKNWGEGVGQGMLYARQFGDQRQQAAEAQRQSAREDERFGFEKQKYETELAQQQAALAERTGLDQQTKMFLSPFLDDDPANDPQGVGLNKQSAMFLNSLPVEQRIEAMMPVMFPKPNEGPSSVQEYEYAKQQGFTGSLLDYQTAKAKAGAASSNTTIYNKDYGSIPPGFRLVETPQGVQMEAVPGSPAEAEAKAAETAADARTAAKEQSTDIVTEDLKRALSLDAKSLFPTTGLIGGALSNIPGTGAYDKARLVETVKANIGFDKLQAMREASPTGGALGQVAVQEINYLQAALGNLEQSQSKEQWDYNAKRVHDLYLDIVHGPGQGPPRLMQQDQGDDWEDIGDGVKIREKP